MGGSSGSSGTSGNVEDAAQEQGEQARWLAREETIANRPDQHNAWGSTTWERTPITNAYATGIDPLGSDLTAWDEFASQFGNNDSSSSYSSSSYSPYSGGDVPMYDWTQTETLNPERQASLDAQFGAQRDRSELANQLSGQLGDAMGTPYDFDQYGGPISYDPTEQRQSAEDAAYGRATSRLDPQYEQEAQALEIALRNKGLRAGDQAYDSQMDTFNRGRTDAYEQARLGATSEGRAEVGVGLDMNERANALRSQQISEDLTARGYTLEEINKLLEGQGIEGSAPSAAT